MASLEPFKSTSSESDETESIHSLSDSSSISELINSCNLDAVPKENIYSMSYNRTGKCIIFYHTIFRDPSIYENRYGCEKDAVRLESLFKKLNFDTQTFKDDHHQKLMKNLAAVSEAGFDDYGCLVCCIMTHGNENGILAAYDKEYHIKEIWNHFRSDKCPTLANKPKIFVIQACQGKEQNFGHKVSFLKSSAGRKDQSRDQLNQSKDFKDIEDMNSMMKKNTTDYDDEDFGDESCHIPSIPAFTDFLNAYATYNGYYSFRNAKHGSYFIQTFCEELEKNYKDSDLFSILTKVIRRIAIEFCSKSDVPERNKLKQMPCFDSSLTKLVKFP